MRNKKLLPVGASEVLQAGDCQGSSGCNPLSVSDPKPWSADASRSKFIGTNAPVKNNSNPPLREMVSLNRATALLPPNPDTGKPLHSSMLYRLLGQGLPAKKINNKWYTHESWLREFFENQTGAAVTVRSQARRRRAAASANQALERAGL